MKTIMGLKPLVFFNFGIATTSFASLFSAQKQIPERFKND